VQSLRQLNRRWIFIPALIAALLLVASRTFLSSTLLRQEIESRLSSSLKGRIAIERISPRGFRGIELSRVRFSAANGTTAQIESVRLRFEISPLLRGKLYPDRVTLSRASANISLAKPSLPESATTQIEGAPPAQRDALPNSRSRVRLWPAHVEIRDAAVDVIDSHLRPLFRGSAISGTLDREEKNQLAGTLSGQSAEVLGTFRTDPWRASLSLERSRIHLREVMLPAGDGSLKIEANLNQDQKTYSLEAHLKHLTLPERDLEGVPTSLNGLVSGQLSLTGSLAGKDQLSGQGELDFHRIDFRALQIVRSLGQVAGSNELAQLIPKPFQSRFAIEKGSILVDNLAIESPVSTLTARGSIQPDNTLNLACSLLLPQKLSAAKWLDDLGDAASSADENGQRTLRFTILGTTTKPHLDIVEKIAKAVLKSKTSGILDLFRPKSRQEPTPDPAKPDR
jgi:hypothetical protein